MDVKSTDKKPGRKYRHEYKFIIDARQKAYLLSKLKHFTEPDPHVGDEGSYWIRSLYFDDMADSSFAQNEAGIDQRTKYRIRIYNVSDSVINLEFKSKKNTMTNKESVRLDRDVTKRLIRGDFIPREVLSGEGAELLRRFDVLMRTKLLRPRCIIEYQRHPFIVKSGNVRITLDDNMSSSLQSSRFFEKDTGRYPIMQPGMSLMEVKYDEYLPSYIKDNLELGRLTQTSFSKYYLGRKYTLAGIGGRLK